MSPNAVPGTIDHERPKRVVDLARLILSHVPIRPTHVETAVAATMLLVDSKTLLKSHSQKGNYSGIRPVRLPSRKLAWPLAEIEKLLNLGGSAK